MRVYFVRHGESEGNALRVSQGSSALLTQKGVEQSKILADRLRDKKVDLVVSSTFIRARQTAEIITKTIPVSVIESDLLVELKRPTAIEGKKDDDPEAKAVKDTIRQNYLDIHFRHSDEETFLEAKERGLKALTFLEGLNTESVLVITHGDVIRIIVALMVCNKDIEPKEVLMFGKFKLKNTGITVCENKDGIWRVITWNDHSHLP